MMMDALNEYLSCESESEQEDTDKSTVHKLPNLLQATAEQNENQADDPQLHDGRIRSIKHERGNWASFVYINVSNTDLIERMQVDLTKLIEESTALKVKNIDNVHLSLTKLLILSHHWIDSFIEKITSQVEEKKSFKVLLNEIEIYTNEEKTRTFVGVKTEENKNLVELTASLDQCLRQFKLPEFYENPSFHISLLWVLGDETEQLGALKDALQKTFDSVIENEDEYLYFTLKELLCKCGNRLYKFPLRSF